MSAVHTQRETDEAQIRQQVARIAEGIRAKDRDSLRPIYATDVVSFDVEPPLQHVGVEAKLKNWANVFAAFRDADYEVHGLTLAVGGDVAFGYCLGRLHGTLMNGRRPRASGSGSRSASGSSTAPGRSCPTRLRCHSTCSPAEE
jgi:ketosteroid isomerase-like protein